MATISAATNEKVYTIPKWFGLNESPDGETRLKIGEAGEMVNFRITRDGNLKRRPGTQLIAGLRYSGYQVNISADSVTLGTYGATDTIDCGTIADVNSSPGHLLITGVSTYTMPNLMTALSNLAPGAYLYILHDELKYAIADGDLTLDDDVYTLTGNRATAVPVQNNTKPVDGLWSGYVGGKQALLSACDGHLYSLYDADNDVFSRDLIGAMLTDKGVSFIPFDGKVYILNGYEYYVYDGTNLTTVAGYEPLIAISIGPLDTDTNEDSVNDTASNPGETTGEYINLLNGKRRVWISPDGTNGTFQLPETGMATIDYVKDLSTGQATALTWSGSTATGQVAFSTVPPKAVNSLEIGYTMGTNYRSQVTGHLFAELFSGTTDTRIFIYGDGTNRSLYTGMDYDGMPRADYFPDNYAVDVGDSNTPITSMIRHYSTLVVYKPNECWALQHGIVELATSDLTPAVYSQPVNREIGNVAPGQVRLVNNNPITLCGQEAYHWTNSSYYTSNLSRDERQAKRISDRVQTTIKTMDLASAAMWDDNDNQEFYIVQDGTALVLNYATDAWYTYSNFDAVKMCNFQGELYLGTSDGKVLRVTYNSNGDEGEAITAYWKSGAMDFGAPHLRKFSSMIWVGLKPVTGTSVDVTLLTDRKDTFAEKAVVSDRARVSGEPFMVRLKLKAKKFVYYHLILQVEEKMPAVTVTDVSMRIRTTGYTR